MRRLIILILILSTLLLSGCNIFNVEGQKMLDNCQVLRGNDCDFYKCVLNVDKMYPYLEAKSKANYIIIVDNCN